MSQIAQALANLEAWLETMRCPGGYGGPVVHWWQNCLQFTGAGLDWRYEGIISGYLTLWRRTGQPQWLEKACRAGDDLVQGQLPGGNFQHASFELNPYAGGTPHEAAADVGLLKLAAALRQQNDPRWTRYVETAERNLHCFYLETLWDEQAQRFWDSRSHDSFVPNKACTLAEALFALAELRQDAALISRCVLPLLKAVLGLQVQADNHLHGGIAQAEQNGRPVLAYFPYYIARCIPALLHAYDFFNEPRWRTAAEDAFAFVLRFIDEDGLLPQVVYPRGINRYPQWLAPLGDVLRVADLMASLRPRDPKLTAMRHAFLAGQRPTGGFVTGRGFAAQVSQRFSAEESADFRDQIPVVGWCDKAFRYLATQIPEEMTTLPAATVTNWQTACHLRGQTASWQETVAKMALTVQGQPHYLWRKGEAWAALSAPEVLWK